MLKLVSLGLWSYIRPKRQLIITELYNSEKDSKEMMSN